MLKYRIWCLFRTEEKLFRSFLKIEPKSRHVQSKNVSMMLCFSLIISRILSPYANQRARHSQFSDQSVFTWRYRYVWKLLLLSLKLAYAQTIVKSCSFRTRVFEIPDIRVNSTEYGFKFWCTSRGRTGIHDARNLCTFPSRDKPRDVSRIAWQIDRCLWRYHCWFDDSMGTRVWSRWAESRNGIPFIFEIVCDVSD